MNSIEQALSLRKGFREVRQGNMFFEKKRFIYQPVSDWASDVGIISYISSYFINLEKSLPLLRKSILDESLPLYVFDLQGLFAGEKLQTR